MFNQVMLRLSFSNQCNFKCGYCDVKSSSTWMEEINQHGGYPTSGMFNNTDWMDRENSYPIPHKKPNPYVDPFWKWSRIRFISKPTYI